MVKRLLICAVAILFVTTIALAGQEAKEGSWHGWITDTSCGAKGANANHAACAKKCVDEKGAKYALFNSADKKVYVLDPQTDAAEHAGHHVTVKGTLDGDTIHVTSISMMGGEKKEKPSGGK
ncbi:MAG: DUF5818 domain-containing protein [Candidatus Acidiferrales bacterium]